MLADKFMAIFIMQEEYQMH